MDEDEREFPGVSILVFPSNGLERMLGQVGSSQQLLYILYGLITFCTNSDATTSRNGTGAC